MVRRGILTFAAAALLGLGAAQAQVVVRIAPPRPMVERRVPAPGPGYIWTPGISGGTAALTCGSPAHG